MNKSHEYSSLEKLEDLEAKKLLFLIPNLKKIKNSKKKIQFISFFAEWCPNCEYEAIELKNYIAKYTSVIDFSIVMQFCSTVKSTMFLSKYKLTSKLIDPECCIKDEELNKKTAFYKFRRTLNDTRKWGVPLHIIRVINQKNIEIFVIKGESIKDEVIDFLDKNLP
tara:strand:+ start:828 stop:1325 length:498 start_codon:yes stop_codon:yes gene_type:complete